MANIIKETVRGLQLIPVEDGLLTKRKIFLTSEVTERSSNEIIKQLIIGGVC